MRSVAAAIILGAHSSVDSRSRKCRSRRTQVIPLTAGIDLLDDFAIRKGKNESASFDTYLTPDRYRGIYTHRLVYAVVCIQAR